MEYKFIQGLCKTLPSLPSIKDIVLEVDRSNCLIRTTKNLLPSDWLQNMFFMNTTNTTSTNTSTISLQLKNWVLDQSCLKVLCQVLRDNDDDDDEMSTPTMLLLSGLTFTNCRWTPCVYRRKTTEVQMTTISIDLVEALSKNTTLKYLHIDVSSLPPRMFSWNNLASVVSKHPTIQSVKFNNTIMSESRMYHLLQTYQQKQQQFQTLNVPSIPYWTKELQQQLQLLTGNKRIHGGKNPCRFETFAI